MVQGFLVFIWFSTFCFYKMVEKGSNIVASLLVTFDAPAWLLNKACSSSHVVIEAFYNYETLLPTILSVQIVYL